MYQKSHMITNETTEMASVMITHEEKDQKTTLATMQAVCENTDALAKSESKDLVVRFYWFSIVPWPLSMTDKWKWFPKNFKKPF